MLINTTRSNGRVCDSRWNSLSQMSPLGSFSPRGGEILQNSANIFLFVGKIWWLVGNPDKLTLVLPPDEISRVLLWDGRRPVGLALTWAESCCFEAAAGAALWRNYGLPLQPQRLNRPRQFVPNLVRLQVFQPSHLQVEHQVFLAQHSWKFITRPDQVILAGCLLVWWIFLWSVLLVNKSEIMWKSTGFKIQPD